MENKQKIIINLIIFGIITLVLIIVVVFPLLKEIKKNSGEIISVRKEIVLSKTQAEKFEEYREIYEKLTPDLEKIDNLFVNPELPIDLIEFWEKTAADSNLLIDISPALPKSAETDSWDSIGFRVILTSSFSNFSKFLEKIEASPYLIEIQNLVIKRIEKGEFRLEEQELTPSEDISATLVIKVFTRW